jgi:hypothetical protein
MSIQGVFLALIGIMLFTAGINSLQTAWTSHKKGMTAEGTVSDCTLRQARDDKDRLIQHYYSLNVSYKENGKAKSAGLKSTREYHPGDPIRLVLHEGTVAIYEKGNAPLSGFFLMMSGVLLIAAEMLYSYLGIKAASYALSAVFACISLAVFLTWRKDHAEALSPHQGRIEQILYYEPEKNQRRIFKTVEKYPLIAYEQNGQTYHYLSQNIAHSNTKPGTEVTFFTSSGGEILSENRSSGAMLFFAIVMAAVCVLGFVSTLTA